MTVILATVGTFVRGLVALANDGSSAWTVPLAIWAIVGWLWLAGEVGTRNAAIDRELQWTKDALDDARSGRVSRPTPPGFRELSQRWDQARSSEEPDRLGET